MMHKNQIIGMVAIVGVLVAVGAAVYSQFFEAGGWAVTSNEDVEAAYRLNTKGDDLRVYEFTPKGDTGVFCIVVAGERNSMMECVGEQ